MSFDPFAVMPPPSTDPVEMVRIEHTRLRRRMLYSQYEIDLDARIRKAVGNVKGDAWKPIDLTANPYLSLWGQVAVMYNVSPEVAAPGADGLLSAVEAAGVWPLMQRVQRDTLGLRELWLRLEANPDGTVVARPVPADMIEAESHPSNPGVPVVIREWMHDKLFGWCRHILDISDLESPAYYVETSEGRDVSADVLGADYRGERYPYRNRGGVPFLPGVLYHAAETGCLFDPYTMREVVEGSLMLGVYLTYFGHVLRDVAWSQRYVMGVRVLGADAVDADGNAMVSRREVVTDPATLLELEPDPAFTGQPLIGQWSTPADPVALLTAISMYERRILTLAGIQSPDVTRTESDIRSGYSLAVSREAVRELQRVYEPQFRRGDLQLLSICAALVNRATGTDYDESPAGYRITYRGLPKSPGELAAETAEVKARMAAGFIGLVSGYMELNPGVPRVAAVEAVANAQLEASEVEDSIRQTLAIRGQAPTPPPAQIEVGKVQSIKEMVIAAGQGQMSAATLHAMLVSVLGLSEAAAASVSSTIQPIAKEQPNV